MLRRVYLQDTQLWTRKSIGRGVELYENFYANLEVIKQAAVVFFTQFHSDQGDNDYSMVINKRTKIENVSKCNFDYKIPTEI